MLRVIAFVPDLLFGSGVQATLQAAGHDVKLVGDAEALGRELSEADVLVVDLTSDVATRLDAVRQHLGSGPRTLAFYSHVESDVRSSALEAGFDQVVPRSRMAREGATLVERLADAAG